MKRIINTIIVTVLVALVVPAVAQKKFEIKPVDFENIKLETQNPKSKNFYPKLMKSFQSNDTTLTFDEYRYLYYGYIYQEDYNPFRESQYAEKIEHLYYKKSYTRAECDTIEKYAELSLEDNIFDLRQMELFSYALKEKKKFTRASIMQYRLNHLIAAILSSGNGTAESPWVVTSAEHEYYILNMLGYVATSHTEMENHIDFITVNKVNDKTPEGFYFDASKIIEVASIKFPQE